MTNDGHRSERQDLTRINTDYAELGCDESLLDRQPRQAGHAVDFELAHQALTMRFHRPRADSVACRDLLVRLAIRDPLEHIALAAGQEGELRHTGESVRLHSDGVAQARGHGRGEE